MKPLRILVADDHDLMRRGLRAILETRSDWEICGEAHTGTEALAKVQKLRPNVAILDISMPEMDGLEAAKQILKQFQDTEILMFSMHYSDQLVRDILHAGIRGYVAKSDSDRYLLLAVEALANHQPFLTPRASELILPRANVDSMKTPNDPLTERERQIVRLVADGKRGREVAAVLGINEKTADTYRANIMRKLNMHGISELVRYALRNKIAEP